MWAARRGHGASRRLKLEASGADRSGVEQGSGWTPRSGAEALEELSAAIDGARAVPLTGSVRMEVEQLRPLVAAVRAAAPTAELAKEADDLARAVLEGPRIPLTDQRRIDPRRARKLIARLRGRIA